MSWLARGLFAVRGFRLVSLDHDVFKDSGGDQGIADPCRVIQGEPHRQDGPAAVCPHAHDAIGGGHAGSVAPNEKSPGGAFVARSGLSWQSNCARAEKAQEVTRL